MAECPVDLDGVEQLGQAEGFGHLDPHPRRARRSGLDQPQAGALAQVEELGFRWVSSLAAAGSTDLPAAVGSARR